MLISIPTGTSTIFGVFQAILLVSFPFQTGLCATADSEANTDFRGDVIHFSEPPAQVCDPPPIVCDAPISVPTRRTPDNFPNNGLYLDTCQLEPRTNNDALNGAILYASTGRRTFRPEQRSSPSLTCTEETQVEPAPHTHQNVRCRYRQPI